MTGVVEHIRTEFNGPVSLTVILLRMLWVGSEPAKEDFIKFSHGQLASYFKNNGEDFEQRNGFEDQEERGAVVVALRFVGDDDVERFRYDLNDLLRDRQMNDVVRN